MQRLVVCSSLLVRIIIAVFTCTMFQPDEFFQSLEPAFHAVFGYGYLTWEWLTSQPIRSILYPALNMPIYAFIKVTGIAEMGSLGDTLLIFCPKFLHGTLAAATDIWLCELTRVTLGSGYMMTTLFLSLSSFFHALALSRSLSNSLETSLSTIAFAYYPWDASSSISPSLIYNKHKLLKVFIFSALACMIRPTNAVIWVYLYLNLCWSLRKHPRIIKSIVTQLLTTGTCALTAILAVDSLYYGRPVLTPYNFLKTNFSSVSLFYGSNPWHYYLTQGLPLLCTTALPFVLHGIYITVFCQQRQARSCAFRNMFGVVVWSIVVYSFSGHKEWRFLHPILPLLHIFAAKSLVDLSASPTSSSQKISKKSRKGNQFQCDSFLPIRKTYLVFLLLTIPVSLYIILFYCSAPISVLFYLQSLPINMTVERGGQVVGLPQSVGFLMPCHSAPGQAYLHRPSWEVWSLGCEPPLQGQNLSTYRDQTDIFFDSPLTYIRESFPSEVNLTFPPSPFPVTVIGVPLPDNGNKYPWRHNWPRHLIFFGALLDRPGIRDLFLQKGYSEVWHGGRDWEGEGERKGGVRVWSWKG